MKPDSVRKPDFLHHQLFLYFFLKSWRTPLTPSSARAIVSKNKNYCLASTRKSSIFLVRPPFVSSNGRGWHRRRLKVAAALAGLSLSVSMSDKSGIFFVLFCLLVFRFLSVGTMRTAVLERRRNWNNCACWIDWGNWPFVFATVRTGLSLFLSVRKARYYIILERPLIIATLLERPRIILLLLSAGTTIPVLKNRQPNINSWASAHCCTNPERRHIFKKKFPKNTKQNLKNKNRATQK